MIFKWKKKDQDLFKTFLGFFWFALGAFSRSFFFYWDLDCERGFSKYLEALSA